LFEASEVVAFHLNRVPTPQNLSIPVIGPFRYPRSVYLDQFLAQNSQLANLKRKTLREKRRELQDLSQKRERLMKVKGKDTLSCLKSSLEYFESYRLEKSSIGTGVEDIEALRRIIPALEQEITSIETKLVEIRKEIDTTFDDKALQKHRYDLRAVLLNDGFTGRSHIYSYVEHNGTWWKTLDYTVTETTEETVLNDLTGHHLGAGAYMLLYSKAIDHVSDVRQKWPKFLMDNCAKDNLEFIEGLSPKAAERARAVLQALQSPQVHAVDVPMPETKDSIILNDTAAIAMDVC